MQKAPGESTLDCQRRAGGVLLPVASLPWGHEIGDLGCAARRWIDWLSSCELGLWQILPCAPLGYGWSPYSGRSSLAIEPLLLDLYDLAKLDLLKPSEMPPECLAQGQIDYGRALATKKPLLELAARRLAHGNDAVWRQELGQFRDSQADWLEDAALYFALHERLGARPFWEWPRDLMERGAKSLARVRADLKNEIATQAALQFLLDRQCRDLKAHAAARGVTVIGDMPLYVATDSADCWARPELFELRGPGHPRLVAGVPPDLFSESGQLWGNPCYDWSAHRAEGFEYWIRRVERALSLAHVVRLDHFRGLSACFEIPAEAMDARFGRWRETPGQELIDTVRRRVGSLPLVAEDLGLIDESVRKLRDDNQLMGMVVLQFAFDGNPKNENLPHHHERRRIVYTGTHDNDTCVGWWEGLPELARRQARQVLRTTSQPKAAATAMVQAAFASVAMWAVVPMQDLLGQNSHSRINLPGDSDRANWTYRLEARFLTERARAKTAELARMFDRRTENGVNPAQLIYK
jgi:4-alpha-glucanotransferase